MGESDDSENLLTPTAFALSLSPPRAPPHDSAHRTVMLAKSSRDYYALAHHHHHDHEHAWKDHHHHRAIRRRIVQLLDKSHVQRPAGLRIPHPHLPLGPELGDQITRMLGVMLPLSWQNSCRDSGAFRTIIDGLITITAPSLALSSPSTVMTFVSLSKRCTRLRYGKHAMNVIDWLLPTEEEVAHATKEGGQYRGKMLFFVHGGAWGSGLPWMYRLVAAPFLNLGMAVAIVGYRTYPDADVQGQIDDLELAASFLATRFPDWTATSSKVDNNDSMESMNGACVLMGHSSGAHIALLMLVDRAKQRQQGQHKTETLEFAAFVGISGPYDISHHFDYEAARGVEELSPMKPVCGYSREEFRKNSPALRWMQHLPECHECDSQFSMAHDAFPPLLLLHGIEDSTVPFTSTAEAARILRSCGVTMCDEIYVAKTAHQDAVMQVMLGGKTRDSIVQWLQGKDNHSRGLVASSKL